MIPPRYVYIGDKEEASKLREFAQSQLEILRNSMSFQDLKQGRRVIRFSNGVIIEAKINHCLSHKYIRRFVYHTYTYGEEVIQGLHPKD